MNSAIRGVVAFITAVGTFYFVYWVGGALLVSLHVPGWIPLIGSAIAAVIVTRYVWMSSAHYSGGLVRSIAVGALVTGGIGFAAGFFGPILFTPGANQGPLLGIFITGPLGFVLGAVGGGVYWRTRRKRSAGANTLQG
jgi:hypothetical protein